MGKIVIIFFCISFLLCPTVLGQVPLSGFSFSGIELLNKTESKFGVQSEEYTAQLQQFAVTCRDASKSDNYPFLVNKLVSNLPYLETQYGIDSEEYYSSFYSLSTFFLHGLEIITFDQDTTSLFYKEAYLYVQEAFAGITRTKDRIHENNPHYYDYVRMLSFIYKLTGNLDEALAFLKKKMSVETTLYGKYSRLYLESIVDLAEISEAMEDRETIDWIILYLKNSNIPNTSPIAMYYSAILRALPNDIPLSDLRIILEQYASYGGDLSSLYRFYNKQALGKRTDVLLFLENYMISKLKASISDIHAFFNSTASITLCYPDELSDFTIDYFVKAVDLANSQGERMLNYNCAGSPCCHLLDFATLCLKDESKQLFYKEKALEDIKIDFGQDSEEYRKLLKEISLLKSTIEMRKSR